jgi:hypothetical protein
MSDQSFTTNFVSSNINLMFMTIFNTHLNDSTINSNFFNIELSCQFMFCLT